MIKYRFLLPELVGDVFEHVKDFIPDNQRNLQAFIQLFLAKDSMFMEVGDFQGVFWFTDIIPGWKANVHVVLWDEAVHHQHASALTFLRELAFKLRLKRINAFIPEHNEAAQKYASRLGFQHEGLIHYGDRYDGKLQDIHVFGLFGEDLDGRK
jgi:RimJ/RimL family protein N-acetyltransferase